MECHIWARLPNHITEFLLRFVNLIVAHFAKDRHVVEVILPRFAVPNVSLVMDVVMLAVMAILAALSASAPVSLESKLPEFLPSWVFEFFSVGLHSE